MLSAFKNGELSIVKGLNRKTTLKRPGDTQWRSHYDNLNISLIILFSSTVKGLDQIIVYDFIFTVHLMKVNLGTTNELSKTL